jgi:hypothetical protein
VTKWAVAVAVVVIAGCGGGEPSSFGVNVTVDAMAVDSQARDRITTARLTVSGDEQYAKSFDITSPIKTGEVRFRYIPKAHSGQITLTLAAVDGSGDDVATGTSDPIDLVLNKAVDARIVLGAPPPDMSGEALDLSALDGGNDAGGDAGSVPLPDMVVVRLNCLAMGKCVWTCLNGGTDLNTCTTQCSMSAKPGSASKWTNAVVCGQNYCVGDTDMMTGRCILVSDPGNPGSQLLCDPGTTFTQCTAANYMSTSCAPCLDQARNVWFEDPSNPSNPPTGMCTMPTSADCMGARTTCMTQFNACLNDP